MPSNAKAKKKPPLGKQGSVERDLLSVIRCRQQLGLPPLPQKQLVDCLSCNEEFMSPDKVRIRICPGCKEKHSYNNDLGLESFPSLVSDGRTITHQR